MLKQNERFKRQPHIASDDAPSKSNDLLIMFKYSECSDEGGVTCNSNTVYIHVCALKRCLIHDGLYVGK